jgi:hypothetical protein
MPTYIFKKHSITYFRVIADTPDEAGEILVAAMDEAKAYQDHVEISKESAFYYHDEVGE